MSLSPELQAKFNPTAKVPMHEYISYRTTLQTYSAFADSDEKSDKKSTEKVDISAELIETSLKIKEKLNTATTELQMKLIEIFFVGIEQYEIMTNFDSLMAEIEKAQPGLIDFFYLPKTKIKDIS
jgi:hypothetical protein